MDDDHILTSLRPQVRPPDRFFLKSDHIQICVFLKSDERPRPWRREASKRWPELMREAGGDVSVGEAGGGASVDEASGRDPSGARRVSGGLSLCERRAAHERERGSPRCGHGQGRRPRPQRLEASGSTSARDVA